MGVGGVAGAPQRGSPGKWPGSGRGGPVATAAAAVAVLETAEAAAHGVVAFRDDSSGLGAATAATARGTRDATAGPGGLSEASGDEEPRVATAAELAACAGVIYVHVRHWMCW